MEKKKGLETLVFQTHPPASPQQAGKPKGEKSNPAIRDTHPNLMDWAGWAG